MSTSSDWPSFPTAKHHKRRAEAGIDDDGSRGKWRKRKETKAKNIAYAPDVYVS